MDHSVFLYRFKKLFTFGVYFPLYVFAFQICNVQCLITHVKSDHRLWAQVKASVFTYSCITVRFNKTLKLTKPILICIFEKLIVKSSLSEKVFCIVFGTKYLAEEAHQMTCFTAVPSYNGFKAIIQKYFIQKNIKMNINTGMSIECLKNTLVIYLNKILNHISHICRMLCKVIVLYTFSFVSSLNI